MNGGDDNSKIVSAVFLNVEEIMTALRRQSINTMEQCISREIQKISPFVYCEIFKRLGKGVKDYAVISIEKDPSDNTNLLIKQVEPVKKHVFSFRTCTFPQDEELIMIVKLEDRLVMLTYNEMAECIRQHPPTSSNPALPDWAMPLFSSGDGTDENMDFSGEESIWDAFGLEEIEETEDTDSIDDGDPEDTL